MFTMNVKMTGFKEATERMDPKKVVQAVKSTLTRVKGQAATKSAQLLAGKYNISQKDLLNKASGAARIQVSGAVKDDLTATLSFKAGGVSLVYFGATETKRTAGGLARVSRKGQTTAKRGPLGVMVRIERGKTTRLKQFIASVRYGKGGSAGVHMGVFRRAGKSRYPIIQSLVISPATMIRKGDVMEPFKQFVQKTFTERFNHELKRLGVTK